MSLSGAVGQAFQTARGVFSPRPIARTGIPEGSEGRTLQGDGEEKNSAGGDIFSHMRSIGEDESDNASNAGGGSDGHEDELEVGLLDEEILIDPVEIGRAIPLSCVGTSRS